MTEKYPTPNSEQGVQQPEQEMVRDEHGDFVLRPIIFAEAKVAQPADLSASVGVQPAPLAGEHLVQDEPDYDDAVIDDEALSQDDAPESLGSDKKARKPARPKKVSKERAPLSVRDKVYRAVGATTLVLVGLAGVAGASNYAATKARYGVDVSLRQQLDNATKLPDKIDQDIEKVKKAMDFMNFFNMKEATGGSND